MSDRRRCPGVLVVCLAQSRRMGFKRAFLEKNVAEATSVRTATWPSSRCAGLEVCGQFVKEAIVLAVDEMCLRYERTEPAEHGGIAQSEPIVEALVPSHLGSIDEHVGQALAVHLRQCFVGG